VSNVGPTPELGNLAWAPLPTVELVEIFDRFNGVPTLGVVRAEGTACLFWRVLSDDEHVSAWMYVPLTAADEEHLRADDDSDFLDGIVFESKEARYVTAGLAYDNRLIFEREWLLLGGLAPDDVAGTYVDFIADTLRIALEQDPPLPPTRRQVVQRASDAVRHLAPC